MWTYAQDSGTLLRNGVIQATGYSGKGPGLNNPDMENVIDVGPIPCGLFTAGTPVDTPKHGRFFIPLIPDPSNDMFGRSGFGMHGDEIAHPGEHLASDGCVIADYETRVTFYNSKDVLRVVRSLTDEDSAWPNS